MKTERDRAIQAARELHATGRYLKREACRAAIAATGCALSPDQLKALAFGAVLHGFGSAAGEDE